MPRAKKICPHVGPDNESCSNMQPCATHAVRPWATSNRRQRSALSGSRQQQRARFILTRDDTICHVCGLPGADIADHLVALAHGGADTIENMAAIHAIPCHREKTEREANDGGRK